VRVVEDRTRKPETSLQRRDPSHGPVVRGELEKEAETDLIEAALSETCLALLLAGVRARDLRIMAMNTWIHRSCWRSRKGRAEETGLRRR
jgi:hypothetical protein